MKLSDPLTPRNASPRIVTLYAEHDGRQVPVFRYWPIPEGVLSAKLSSKAKLLLGLIYRHAGRGGRLTGQSHETLAGALGLSSRAVRRHLAALVDVGLVEVLRSRNPEQPDSYQLQLLHPWMREPVVHVPIGLDLSPAALLVYAWLAWRQGSGWAGRWATRQLAEGVGLQPRQTTYALRELERAGFVSCSRLQGRATAYLLLDHQALGAVLIEGRAVATAAPPAPSAAPPASTAVGPAPSAGLNYSSYDSASESSSDSVPRRGLHYPPAGPSGRSRPRGRRARASIREFDPEEAKTLPEIGW